MSESDRELQHTEPEKHGEENEDFPSIELALTAAFLFGAVVFGFLAPPYTLIVSFALLIPAAALLGSSLQSIAHRRRKLSSSVDQERELLTAIRNSSGSITPAEAAMETSLTVREADKMLTGLANEGHLKVESRDGTLSYNLPARENREIE